MTTKSGIAKDDFQETTKVLWNGKFSLERVNEISCCVIPFLEYDSKFWKDFSHMKLKFGATKMWLYRRMMRTRCTEYVDHDELLKKTEWKEHLYLYRIRKR